MEKQAERKAPWQFYWKQPSWNETTRNTSRSAVEGDLFDSSAARITSDELPRSSSATTTTKTVDDAILIATLRCSNGSFADTLTLEIIHEDAVVHERCLQWPKSAMRNGSTLLAVTFCRKPVQTNTLPGIEAAEVLHMMSLGMGEVSAPGRASAREAGGGGFAAGGTGVLQLVCLTSDGQMHFYKVSSLFHASDTQSQRRSGDDALSDAFASMMLGDSLHKQIINDILPLSTPDTTVHLTLHLEKPKTILQTNPKDRFSSSESTRSFDLFQLPLLRNIVKEDHKHDQNAVKQKRSQASRTVDRPESQKLRNDNLTQQGEVQEFPHAIGDDMSRTSETPSLQGVKDFFRKLEPRKNEAEIAIWENSRWDITVEPSSMKFRTLRNKPRGIKPIFSFIVVWGEGCRIKDSGDATRKRQNNLEGRDIFVTGSAGQTTAQFESKKSIDSLHHGKKTDEHSGLALESVEEVSPEKKQDHTDVSPQGSSSPDRLVREVGGFVVFVSLSHGTETKKIYFPFVPTNIYPAAWGGMSYAIVLGRDGFGNTPYATAICLDVSVNQITHEANSSYPTMEEAAKKKAQKPSDEFPPLSMRRFQQIPVVIPVDEHILTTGVKSFSVIPSSPPSLLVMYTNIDGLDSEESKVGFFRTSMHDLDYIASDNFAIHPRYRAPGKRTAAIITRQNKGQRVVLPNLVRSERLVDAVCLDGEGWSFVDIDGNIYFICWEGATEKSGAYLSPFIPKLSSGWLWSEVLQVRNARAQPRNGDFRDNPETSCSDTGQSPAQGKATMGKLTTTVEDSSCGRVDTALHSSLARESVIFGQTDSFQRTLSLRAASNQTGGAQVEQVITWLSSCNDYYTAASIGLSLLNDLETLGIMRLAISSDDTDWNKESFIGLLDGLAGSGDISVSQKISLANMTVTCLIEGGRSLSTALNDFLRKNQQYDPKKTSEMLVDTADKCLAHNLGKQTLQAPGQGWDDVIWALHALVELGVARDHLGPSLLLLNASLKDEVRNRGTRIGDSASRLEFAKAIVGSILQASQDAPSMLLGLTEGESKERYWDSLDEETKMEFALIQQGDRFPLFHEMEVRQWLVGLLNSWFGFVDAQGGTLPSGFLQNVALACILNAGCDLKEALSGPVLVRSHDAQNDAQRYLDNALRAQTVLASWKVADGIDSDLLIRSLLLLEGQKQSWHEDSDLPCQLLLDAACRVASRPISVPRYRFDATATLKLCAKANNISAGANIVGGHEGLVLKCSEIIMRETGIEMESAESFLLTEGALSDTTLSLPTRESSATFTLREGHKQLLLLLQENVLSTKTYGEFYESREVDPVIAARLCFRSWARLTNTTASSEWLVQWLRTKLSLGTQSNRLSCAAIAKALLWPNPLAVGGENSVLGTVMGLDTSFLVQVTKSCCGLVEALPEKVLESMFVGDVQT